MNKKLTIVIFALVIVILVGAIVFSVGNSAKTSNTLPSTSTSKLSGLVVKDYKTYYQDDENEMEDGEEDDSGYTNTNNVASNLNNSVSVTGNVISISELAKHSSESDCWVVYQGKVYDLTSWLTKHPGGVEAISPYCGTQGFEAAFIKKHGDTKASLFFQVAKLTGDFQLKGSLN